MKPFKQEKEKRRLVNYERKVIEAEGEKGSVEMKR